VGTFFHNSFGGILSLAVIGRLYCSLFYYWVFSWCGWKKLSSILL